MLAHLSPMMDPDSTLRVIDLKRRCNRIKERLGLDQIQ
jgi:hypothetical protein